MTHRGDLRFCITHIKKGDLGQYEPMGEVTA